MTTDATREHCIDAETLAAWADRGLSAADADRVELHLSNCERCQEVLAAFMRSQPSAAAVIPFWTRRSVRLGAAGLAVAASLMTIIWTARPPSISIPESTVASRELAPTVPPPELTSAVTAPPSSPVPTPPVVPKSSSAPVRTRALESVSLPALPVPPASMATSPPVPPAQAPVVRGIAGQAVSAAAPISGMRDASVAEKVNTELETVEIVAPDPRATDAQRQNIARAGVSGGRGGAGAVPARWRILARTRVERSIDGGTTWTPANITSASPFVLTGGAAASPTVCWLVGRDGAVFVTSDGVTFQRVLFPDRGHLKSVQAIDALHAIVTTQDGRTFSTADGGATWVSGGPLQGF